MSAQRSPGSRRAFQAASTMFMNNDEWSDDDIDPATNDDMVVPVNNLPTPQVISRGGGDAAETQYRASAYNERMARARQASQRKIPTQGACSACRLQHEGRLSAGGASAGMVQSNSDRPSRPTTASGRAAPIDVISQEVEEMELADQQTAQPPRYQARVSEHAHH